MQRFAALIFVAFTTGAIAFIALLVFGLLLHDVHAIAGAR